MVKWCVRWLAHLWSGPRLTGTMETEAASDIEAASQVRRHIKGELPYSRFCPDGDVPVRITSVQKQRR